MKVRFYTVHGRWGTLINTSVDTLEKFEDIPTHSPFPGIYKDTMNLFFLETSPIFNYVVMDTHQCARLLEKTNTLNTFIEIIVDKIIVGTGL